MEYSLAHEQGLGDHLGVLEQVVVELGSKCRQRDTLMGASLCTNLRLNMHFETPIYPKQQD